MDVLCPLIAPEPEVVVHMVATRFQGWEHFQAAPPTKGGLRREKTCKTQGVFFCLPVILLFGPALGQSQAPCQMCTFGQDSSKPSGATLRQYNGSV